MKTRTFSTTHQLSNTGLPRTAGLTWSVVSCEDCPGELSMVTVAVTAHSLLGREPQHRHHTQIHSLHRDQHHRTLVRHHSRHGSICGLHCIRGHRGYCVLRSLLALRSHCGLMVLRGHCGVEVLCGHCGVLVLRGCLHHLLCSGVLHGHSRLTVSVPCHPPVVTEKLSTRIAFSNGLCNGGGGSGSSDSGSSGSSGSRCCCSCCCGCSCSSCCS